MPKCALVKRLIVTGTTFVELIELAQVGGACGAAADPRGCGGGTAPGRLAPGPPRPGRPQLGFSLEDTAQRRGGQAAGEKKVRPERGWPETLGPDGQRKNLWSSLGWLAHHSVGTTVSLFGTAP